jgi:hypothetical protein
VDAHLVATIAMARNEVALAAVATADLRSGGDLLEYVGRNGDDLEATGSIQLFPECVVQHANASLLLGCCRLERGVNQLKTEECDAGRSLVRCPFSDPTGAKGKDCSQNQSFRHWAIE